MQVYDLSRHEAANLLLYISLGMMAGCISGFLSDKMKRRKEPFIFFVLIYIASWLLLTLWGQANPPESLLPVLLFMMGLGGASPVLALTCAKEVNHPSLAGVATGSANIGGFLGISILQPLMGYLLDRNWQGAVVEGVKVYPREAYFTVFLLCLVVLVATAWTVLLLKETHAVNVVE